MKSGRKEVSTATLRVATNNSNVTLMQPMEYLPTDTHQNSSVSNSPKSLDKIQKKHLYRVNLNLKRIGENSHPSVCCFLLLINTFLLVFENIFFPLEANPVQMASFVFLSSGFGEFESGSLGGEGKAFNIASKMPCCCKKRTQSNHKEFPAELWVTPKLVWEPIIKTCPVQYMSPYTSKLS